MKAAPYITDGETSRRATLSDDSLPSAWPWGDQRDQPVPAESWDQGIVTNAQHVSFPIVQLELLANGWTRTDKDELGSCFFIGHGIFLTAWHVVEKAVSREIPLSVLLLRDGASPGEMGAFSAEPVNWVRQLMWTPPGFDEVRPTDIAMGMIRVPVDFRTPVWKIGTRPLDPGARVATHGYSRTIWQTYENDDGEPCLAMNLRPRFYRATVMEYLPEGRGITRWPVFALDVDG